MDVPGRYDRVFIEAMPETSQDSDHAHFTARGENSFEKHLALNLKLSCFLGVGGPRPLQNLHGFKDGARRFGFECRPQNGGCCRAKAAGDDASSDPAWIPTARCGFTKAATR